MKITLFILLFTSSVGWSAPLVLKLSQTLKQGFDYSLDIKKADSVIKEAEGQLSKNRGSLFPNIEARASATTRQNSATFLAGGAAVNGGIPGETFIAGLNFSQPLYAGGAITSGLSFYKTLADQARQSYFAVKQEFATKLISSYYTLSQSQGLMGAATQNRNVLKSYVDINSHYEKIGRARKIDRMQSVVNYTMSLAKLEEFTNTNRVAQGDIRNALGLTGEPQIEADFTVTVTPIEKLSSEQAFKSAVKNNPLIRNAQLVVENVDYNKDMDLAADFPYLGLTGNFGYQSPDRNSLFNNTSQTYAIGINLVVPIFSGFSSFAKRSIYSEKLYQAKYNLQTIENNLRSYIESAISTLASSKVRLDLAQESNKESKTALDLANKGYQQGTVASLDVFNMQKLRFDAETSFVNSQYAYLQALMMLRYYMGIDLEKTYGH